MPVRLVTVSSPMSGMGRGGLASCLRRATTWESGAEPGAEDEDEDEEEDDDEDDDGDDDGAVVILASSLVGSGLMCAAAGAGAVLEAAGSSEASTKIGTWRRFCFPQVPEPLRAAAVADMARLRIFSRALPSMLRFSWSVMINSKLPGAMAAGSEVATRAGAWFRPGLRWTEVVPRPLTKSSKGRGRRKSPTRPVKAVRVRREGESWDASSQTRRRGECWPSSQDTLKGGDENTGGGRSVA